MPYSPRFARNFEVTTTPASEQCHPSGTSSLLPGASPLDLLSLPQFVLREVLSRSPDFPSANNLLAACQTTHLLRSDPSAAALLLMRCPCSRLRHREGSYVQALSSSSSTCEGGCPVVVRQVLRLLSAGADNGGPHTAPAPLLQAMLVASSEAGGDACSIGALLALPQPPDVNASSGQALQTAVQTRAGLTTLEALLEGGADPCLKSCIFFDLASRSPDLDPLQLLLKHCPASQHRLAVTQAFSGAIKAEQLAAVEHLLPLLDVAAVDFRETARIAASLRSSTVLRRLLDHRCPPEDVQALLVTASTCRRAACVDLLLARGAQLDVDEDFFFDPLHRALSSFRTYPDPVEAAAYQLDQQETVAVMLRWGVLITPAVLELERQWSPALTLMLHTAAARQAAAAPGG